MKILDLKLQAFGPFLKEQHIPFSTLNDKGMFLINGPTGVGKTSIFDAIVYALYGKGSGEDRNDAKSLRSDFASEDVRTSVELIFEANHQQYKIIRKPAHERSGKKTPDAPVAELYLPDGRVISKLKEVDDKLVNEILFITRDQFKNIALLAQGEFTKLITASSNERSGILEHIFAKHIYNEFQVRLNDYSKEAYKKVSNSIATCQTLLNQIDNGNEIIGYQQAYEEPSNIPDFLVHFKEQIEVLENELAKREETLKVLQDEFEKENNKLNAIKQNNAIVETYLKAVNELDALMKEKEKYEQLTKQIDLINEHNLLEPLFKQLEGVEKALIRDSATAFVAKKELEKLIPEEEWLKNNLNNYKSKKETIIPLTNSLKNLKSINAQRESLVSEKESINKLDAAFVNHYHEFEIKEKHYQEIREKFFASTSYNLAKELKEGTPCPVCGSIHHPSLAHLSDPVSEVDFKKAEAEYKNASIKINEEKNNLDSKKSALSSKEASLIIQLKENNFENASVEFIYSNEMVELIKSFENDIKELEKFIAEYEKRDADYKNNFNKHTQTVKSSEALVLSHNENKKSILESINKVYEVNKVIKNKNDYDAFDIKLTVESIKRSVDAYKNACLKNETIIKNTPRDLIEAGQIDESTLVITVNEKREAYEQYAKENNLLNNRINNYKKNYKDINKAYLDSKEIIDYYDSINEVSNIATGSNRKKLSFKMYILADYFDKIIHQANKRLHKITNGRYTLIRRDESKTGRGLAGLDLDVYDVETGKNRAAATLSGGEKFVSALSMALGLSDIIETNRALIQVESIFIDEGFGTLDEDYLDMAMKALESLKEDDKSVAIISHVEKLKDYIPDTIEVEKADIGSKITIKNAI